MEQTVQDRLNKFVELSKEFTVDEREIYQNTKVLSNPALSRINYISYDSVTINMSGPTKTKTELLEEELNDRLQKAKRFEEYIQLQQDLSKYFQSLENLKK